MNRLERILRTLFWLPILLDGIVGLAAIEPRFHELGIISAAALALFLVLILWQAALERRSLARARQEQKANVEGTKPASPPNALTE